MATQLEREREVIRAMQWRQRRWHGPLVDFLWRKPWRAPSGPHLSLRCDPVVNLGNLIGWLRFAHDCADPSIGCSCSGGFRFPHTHEGDASGYY